MDQTSLKKKLEFIESYKAASNAATGSKYDSNANVTQKNIATLQCELGKKDIIEVRRAIMRNYLTNLYGEEVAKQYFADLGHHIIYQNDETTIFPYTYSAKEVVNVKYNGQLLLVSMDQLYALVDMEEVLLDEKQEVYGKFPQDLQILDKDGWTTVRRLIRKKRHRDLVRVKTAFGEDLIVTDNHPLIVSDNIDDTIEAKDGAELNGKQFKLDRPLEWNVHQTLDLTAICDGHIFTRFDTHFTSQTKKYGRYYLSPNSVDLTEELGYLVGFFIGDGNYVASDEENIQITQKDRDVLEKLANIAIKYFNAPCVIRGEDGENKYNLHIYSFAFAALLRKYFKIGSYAQNKTLPVNILETNREFARGVVWGLVDSDGTTKDGTMTIRLSSRAGTNQLFWVLKELGYTVGCVMQEAPVGFQEQVQKGYKQNYTLWGVSATVRDESLLSPLSFKAKDVKVNKHTLKYKNGWVNITDVRTVKEGLFLNEINEYIYDITTDSHSFICNNLWVHNCAAISIYPFLLDGLKILGGSSGAPSHANSFIGGLINLVFMGASQFAGALAIPEFFCAFDHYLRVDYGNDYVKRWDETMESWGNRRSTLKDKIYDWFQQFVYSINQPAGARNYQSPFINIAYFDEYYFRNVFHDYIFPDGDEPCWETTKELQKLFMSWFNDERTRAVLTFPVETANLLVTNYQYADDETADFMAEMWSKGHSFFMYQSDSVDALASCCFSGDQLARVKIDGVELDLSFADLYAKYGDSVLDVYHLGDWKKGRTIKLPPRPIYRIRLDNDAVLLASDNHIHVLKDREVATTDLVVGDTLRCYEHGETVYSSILSVEQIPYHGSSIYCFAMEDQAEPYFTLSNGVVTHNCRLRNEIQENVFSYTLGAGGVKTGSKCVITLNLNRITQDWYNQAGPDERMSGISEYITSIITRVHKYLNGWNAKLWDDFEAGLLPMYTHGFIDLDKQYLTCGVNGFVEAAEFLATKDDCKYKGMRVAPDNVAYKALAADILGTIKRANRDARTEHAMFNQECVPGENLAGKFYNWDKADGYVVPQGRVLYNSYFYRVEDPTVDPVSKFFYQGTGFATECDGGVALHNNLSEHLTKAQYRKLMDVAVQAGCNYWTFNIPNTICNDCEHIDKRMLTVCPKCGSTNLDYATRIIGYLKRVSNFSELRQAEEKMRYYGDASSVKLVDSETEER